MSTQGRSGFAPAGGDSPFPHVSDELVPWPFANVPGAPALKGDDLFPWPWLRSLATQHGGNRPTPPAGYSVARGKAKKMTALRLGSTILIHAQGELPNLNQIADIRQLPIRVSPPHFELVVYTPPITLPALRPFSFTELFGYPTDAKTVRIDDADGPQIVEIIEPSGSDAAPFTDRAVKAGSEVATGLGASLQEAFDHAVAQIPIVPTHPDQLITYELVESGFMRGGFPGFHHYYAKVKAKA